MAMAYRLCDNVGDSVQVPQLIFNRLCDTEEEFVRVALYMVSTKKCDVTEIKNALHIKDESTVKQAMTFWKGAGLIKSTHSSKQHVTETKQSEKKHHRLTTQQVLSTAQHDESVSFLVQECQRLVGAVITQSDINVFVSMYAVDEMPVDLILIGVAHFVSLGKRSARYIERAMLGWQKEGITTCLAAERYLKELKKRDEYSERAFVALGYENIKATKTEQMLILDWFELYNYDETMITEAAAAAGDKKSVRYVGGILRKWHTSGIKTVKDVIATSNTTMQNVSVSNPNAKSVLTGAVRPVPVFNNGGDKNDK